MKPTADSSATGASFGDHPLPVPSGDNNRKLTPDQRDAIARRYTTRLPDGSWCGAPTIARDYGVATWTIYLVLRRRGIDTRTPKEAQTARRQRVGRARASAGSAPTCKCGCGAYTTWDSGKSRWRVYARGHYRRAGAYKNREWLVTQYMIRGRTVRELADECGVAESTVVKFMEKYAISRRDQSARLIGRVTGERNPAWRGGVANWEYSPEWKRLALAARTRDQWTCQDCGQRRRQWGKSLHVHHVDGDKLNDDMSNLISLCARCHSERHRTPVARKSPVAPAG